MLWKKLSGGPLILLPNSSNTESEGPTIIRGFCENREKLPQNRSYKHFLRKSLREAKKWLHMTFQLFLKKCSKCDALWKKLSGGLLILSLNSFYLENEGQPLGASVEIGKNYHKIAFTSIS